MTVNNVDENYILYGNLNEIILNMNDGYCKKEALILVIIYYIKTTEVI